jgi:hypothetical protein
MAAGNPIPALRETRVRPLQIIRWIGTGAAHRLRATPSSLPPTVFPRTLNLIRATVLASSALLMMPGAWGHSVTDLEFAHLPAGLAAWQRHSLGIYRVCAPLSKFLYALPAYLAGVRVDYPESFDSDIQFRREWRLGLAFQRKIGERYLSIFRRSRLLPILITILSGFFICEWSTRLFGAYPGIVSLCLWCWMPPVLAHGALITSDILSAAMLILATRCFWSFLFRPSLPTSTLAGFMLGLALATKFTLLILYPCWALLLMGRVLQLRGEGGKARPFLARFALSCVLVFIVSIVVLDGVYLFQGLGLRLASQQSYLALSSLAKDVQHLRKWPATAWLLQLPIPIPIEYVRGLDLQLADTELMQSAYLLGRTRVGGWWYWYPVASLIKIPLPVLVLLGLALIRLPVAMRQCDRTYWGALCLLLPAAGGALIIAGSTGTGTDAAFRYLLPSIAVLCVYAGHSWKNTSRTVRSIVVGLLGWLAINAVAALPDHLSWQNEIGGLWRLWTGRPALLGDSFDWGQDLVRLEKWISYCPNRGNIVICVHGLGESEPYGLRSPSCRPTSDPGKNPAYLAVSEQLLFFPDLSNCITVGGMQSRISDRERKTLIETRPCERVGQTIRIYRISDFTATLGGGGRLSN